MSSRFPHKSMQDNQTAKATEFSSVINTNHDWQNLCTCKAKQNQTQLEKDASSTLSRCKETKQNKPTKKLSTQLLCTTGDAEDTSRISVIQVTLQNVQETSSDNFWAKYILSTHSHRKRVRAQNPTQPRNTVPPRRRPNSSPQTAVKPYWRVSQNQSLFKPV